MIEHLANVQIAYFAGFFDGEGCIYLGRSKKKGVFHTMESSYTIHCSVVNTYKPIVDEFGEAFDGTVSEQHRSNCPAHWKDRWIWRSSGLPAARFLTIIAPFLKEKQARANAALFFCDTIAWPKVRSETMRTDKKGNTYRNSVLSPEAVAMRQIAIRGLIQRPNALRGGHRADFS